MISFTSTSSRCGVPFWKSRRVWLMISAARVTSVIILEAASPRLFDLWGAGGEQAQAGPGVYDCSRDRLLHFVRQGSSQLAHHGHPADVCEICLRLTQALFRLPALGDGRCAAHELYQIPGDVQNRTADGVDIFDRSVRKEDSEFHFVFRLFSYRAIEYP